MRKIFVLASSFLTAAPVQGAEAAIAHGRAAMHGDLSTEKSAPLSLLQARQNLPFHRPLEALDFSSYFGFEILQSEAAAKSTPFPFEAGSSLKFLGFFMTPGFCIRSGLPFEMCAGIGIGTLNVNARDNRQDYGTWNYETAVRYPFGDGFFVRVAGKKVGDVEQTSRGRSAHFWMTSWLLAIGVGD